MGKVSIIPSYRTVSRIGDVGKASEDLFLRGMNLPDEGVLRKIFWIPMILFRQRRNTSFFNLLNQTIENKSVEG